MNYFLLTSIQITDRPDPLAFSKVSLRQYHRVEKTKGWIDCWCWGTLHTQQPTYNHLQTFHLFAQYNIITFPFSHGVERCYVSVIITSWLCLVQPRKKHNRHFLLVWLPARIIEEWTNLLSYLVCQKPTNFPWSQNVRGEPLKTVKHDFYRQYAIPITHPTGNIKWYLQN